MGGEEKVKGIGEEEVGGGGGEEGGEEIKKRSEERGRGIQTPCTSYKNMYSIF